MYKVIIVDDEPIIVEGLKLGIEWANWNCEIAGTASNGLAGLELMRKIKPDILISDISMNNMDGLAMVAAIKSEYPDIEVCLLTGFRNFEYAQQAIKLGVTRFLLKPSKIDELEEAISAMTNNLKQKGNDSSNAEIDSIWSRSDEEENYIYETFIIQKDLNLETIFTDEIYYSKAKWINIEEIKNMISNGEIEFPLIERIEKYILPFLKSKN